MFKNIILLFCVGSLVSCDPGDDNSGSNGANTDFSYFPLAVTNSWDYDVVTGADSSSENLTVASMTGNEYTLAANPVNAVGFMTRILSGGALKADSGKLIGNGTIDFGLQGLNNFNVIITNGTLYDQNANAGEVLYGTTGSTTQTVQNFDLNINYEVTTVQQAPVSQMTVEGISFTDLLHSQLIITASITTDVSISGFTQQIPLLQSQEVIVIDNYWAKDVGLVKSENQLDYTLEDFSSLGVSLPVPQSAQILTVQSLTGHTLN
ncbi:chorismate synthase [Nonlabens sp.]|uniref:chorismate synthase n=1 Tax=Nonlabens sp. TaxID=1888209 RepID=UPI001BD0C1FD|nr:chorismate synthase [Nonlabens sp.]